MSSATTTRRIQRNRSKVRAAAGERPRLSVYRSNQHIYAQIIDDTSGTTIAQVASKALKTGSKTDTAAAVGRAIGEAGVAKGVKSVVFDRGGYKYHGRVKALAEAAREAGLDF